MSRYIDADKLIEEIKDRIKAAIEWGKSAETEEIKIRAEQTIATFCEVSLTAKKSSTANVRENVRGKWIIKTDGFVIKRVWGVCSECGNTLDFSGVNAGRGDANFCPNCGADMRGDQT